MIVIGERLNSSRQAVHRALRARDSDFLIKEARRQIAGGADYIDVNAAALGDEEREALVWMVQTIQAELDCPLSIDTPNIDAAEAALRVHGGTAFLNSITAETARLDKVVPLISVHKPRVVALCLGDGGVPGPEETSSLVQTLTERLDYAGLGPDDIFFDPIIMPLSTQPDAAGEALARLRSIKGARPSAQTICGLSNISFGLPGRSALNAAFLAMLSEAGLDAVIADPVDATVMSLLRASMAVAGRDPGCAEYMQACRRAKKAD
jgi:cobalamin-dependent methionine synthase I